MSSLGRGERETPRSPSTTTKTEGEKRAEAGEREDVGEGLNRGERKGDLGRRGREEEVQRIQDHHYNFLFLFFVSRFFYFLLDRTDYGVPPSPPRALYLDRGNRLGVIFFLGGGVGLE